MDSNKMFHYISQYTQAKFRTNEFSINKNCWEDCKIQSFNIIDNLVTVFHPKSGDLIPLDPLNADGFLVLKRIEDMSDDDAIEIGCAFTGWPEERVWLAGRDTDRIIMQCTLYDSKEFNIGVGENEEQFWLIDFETAELNQINCPKGMSTLSFINYGFSWMFDSLNPIATQLQ